jgi:hypothetical protein
MRQGQNNNNNKRMRGRNRKGPNPLTRSYESNGPDVKVRGTAVHIAEKYMQLARDAQSSGDRVQAESYLQHAEHYYRIVSAAQAQNPQQPQQVYRNDADGYGDDDDDRSHMSMSDQRFQPFAHEQPSFSGVESQPYVNGNGQERRDEQPQQSQPPQQQPSVDEAEDAPIGAEPQPEANFRPEGGEPPREGRREGFRPRRRRPYRERGDRPGAPEGGSPQPEGAGAGGEE